MQGSTSSKFLEYIYRGWHSSLFFFITNVFSRSINLFFLPYTLKSLSLGEFGILDTYQYFFSVFSMLVTSCAATSMLRFFILFDADSENQKTIIGNSFFLGLFSALFFCSFFFLIQPRAFGNQSTFFLLPLNVFLYTLFSLFLTYLRMKELVFIYSACLITQSIAATLGTLVGISQGFGISSYLYATLLSLAPFSLCFFYIFSLNTKCSFTLLKKQIFYAAPLLFYSFLYSFFSMIDRYFVFKLGDEQLGNYGVLLKLGSIFQMISVVLNEVSPLIFFKAQHEEQSQNLLSQLLKCFIITLISSGVLTLLGSFILLSLFLPTKYLPLRNLIPIFFLQTILFEVSKLLQTGFFLANKTFYSPLTAILTLGIQFLILILYQPKSLFEILACNSIAYFFYGLFGHIASIRCYQRLINTTLFAKYTASILLIVIITAFLQERVNLGVHLLLSLSVWCVFVSLWLLDRSEIRRLGNNVYYKKNAS
jgi:O-antigen/teichoic acid export membrane protein